MVRKAGTVAAIKVSPAIHYKSALAVLVYGLSIAIGFKGGRFFEGFKERKTFKIQTSYEKHNVKIIDQWNV